MDRDQVLTRRLATQRLTGPPAADPVQVVRELLCVQAQDAPLARAMIAHRCHQGTDSAVAAAVASGSIVRTHILRPTWHYLAAEDLRWLLELTTPKVDAPLTARERQLGFDRQLVERGLAVIAERLSGRQFAARPLIGDALAASDLLDRGNPVFGQQVGHLLMLAEYRALICSAPVASATHHYALVDEVIAPTRPRTRTEALTELVERFITGHGPVAVKELQRWTRVTLADIGQILDRLAGRITRETVAGVELWSGPDRTETRPQRAWLLSTFDEAYLTYPLLNFPRTDGHPSDGPDRFAQAGGGPVICDLRDVGDWRRRMVRGRAEVTLRLDPTLTAAQRTAVAEAADRLRAAAEG